MNNTIIMLYLGACVGVIYTFVVYELVKRKHRRKTVKKFEYYSFCGTHGDTTNEYLDELGTDGWEAYAVVPNGDTIVVYLKREKQ